MYSKKDTKTVGLKKVLHNLLLRLIPVQSLIPCLIYSNTVNRKQLMKSLEQ